MKIQEQIINIENGQEYWKIYFEFIVEKQLTLLQWELINNQINKMIYEFQNLEHGKKD
jgi:hypothetical protein